MPCVVIEIQKDKRRKGDTSYAGLPKLDAYGNQPHIAGWNLARFAETLLPLLHANQATRQTRGFFRNRCELNQIKRVNNTLENK
ncbi:MAG: hypothetical protein KGZ96_10235 [Clostridia bacterium]|nr:hypothetical protein [Clostridia bacterium]